MNQLETALEQNGFHKIETPSMLSHKHASSMWQIRIKSPSGATLYFINAFLYERFKHLNDAIEFEVRLYPSLNQKHWITLEFHGCNQESDVHTAMEFFRHAYGNLWCQPDPHNQ